MTTPRYLRFAQALALCTGLATVPACPSSTTGTTDSGPGSADAPPGTDAPSGLDAPIAMTDAPPGTDAPAPGTDAPAADDAPATGDDAPVALGDAGDICLTCQCFGPLPVDAGPDSRPDCWTVPGAEICCAVIGPLSPPDLPA